MCPYQLKVRGICKRGGAILVRLVVVRQSRTHVSVGKRTVRRLCLLFKWPRDVGMAAARRAGRLEAGVRGTGLDSRLVRSTYVV